MTDRNSIETLKLYQNPKLYNGSRYKVFQDNINYESWLANNSDGYDTFEVTYQSISQPITLGFSLPEMDSYTYGSITNAGKTYYFFVDTIQTDQFQMTTIEFTVDWWSTYWSQATCTKAHISRSPTKPSYMEQPYTPLVNESTIESLTSDYCIIATYIPSTAEEGGTSYISQIVLEGNDENLRMVDQGYWYQVYGLAGADVKDSFIVPLFTYDYLGRARTNVTYYVIRLDTSGGFPAVIDFFEDWAERYDFIPSGVVTCYNEFDDSYYDLTFDPTQSLPLTAVNLLGKSVDLSHTEYEEFIGRVKNNVEYKYLKSSFNGDNTSYPPTKVISAMFHTTEIEKQGIMDWNGDSIWECPFGKTVYKLIARLQYGVSHIFIQFLTPEDTSDTKIGNTGDLLTGIGFTYDCRHPALFVDSYQDYILKNRDYDIAMRNIQSEKQLFTSVSSIFENIGFGAAFGDVKGATAAGIGGTIETVGTYLINAEFDPKIQKQYDRHYGLMTDQITIIGDTITPLYYRDPLYYYTLKMDSTTIDRYADDVSNNGFYCDETTNDLQSQFTNQSLYYPSIKDNLEFLPVFQADNITVEGSVPLACKQQIVRRLQNGVEFI